MVTEASDSAPSVAPDAQKKVTLSPCHLVTLSPCHPINRWDLLWLLVCAVASSLWTVTAACELSATFDEPIYVYRGLERWRTGSKSGILRMGTMPLPVDVCTLPLYLWERWQGRPLDPYTELDQLLPYARAGTLVFWWLLLSYGWLAGRALAGPWAGRWAAAALACEPNLLSHAGLATTDIAATACLLAFVYHFRLGRESARWRIRVGLPTFWFCASVLAKASGLVFGILLMVVLELERVAQTRVREDEQVRPDSFLLSAWRSLWRDSRWIVGLGLALVFVYCGCDWQPDASFQAWARSLPESRASGAMIWLADHLCIFSNAGEAIARQVKHNLKGHGVYILGQTHPRALWYYFPVVMSVKLPVPLLLAPLVLLLVRPRQLLNWACLAAAALALFSLTCRVQIGLRFMFPLMVLAVIGLTAGCVRTCQEFGLGWRRRLLAGGAFVGLAWTTGASLIVWPHGLSYVNECWGGTANGYVYVSEANYDWGQGLKELRRWQEEHGLPELSVWYFGTDPAYKVPPLHGILVGELPYRGPEETRARVRGQYVAVSATLLCGALLKPPQCEAMQFFRGYRPIGRTTTFFIYDFTHEAEAPPSDTITESSRR